MAYPYDDNSDDQNNQDIYNPDNPALNNQPANQQPFNTAPDTRYNDTSGQPQRAVDYSGWNTPYLPPTNPAQPASTVNPAASAAPFNYEAARDDWQGGGWDVSTPDAARRSAAAWAQKHGIPYNGSDTITLPNGGGQIDILGNFGGGAGNGRAIARNWTPAGGNGPNPGGSASGAAAGGGIAGMGSMFASSGLASNPLRDQLIQTLLKRSQQSLNVDAATDPNIRAQADPYRANVERSARNYLADQAERLGPGANIQGEARLAQERAGQASGLHEAGLIGKEIDARRQEIQDALNGALGALTADQEMMLRKELSYMNDATQRLGLQNQYDLGLRSNDLGLRHLGLQDWIAQNQDFYRRSGL